MDAFGTSNAELARYANLDGSSVSRYRSGKRSVRSDDPILRSFCSYFAVLCKSRGVPEALAGELNASDGGCGECEALAARLLEWICEDSAKRPWLSRGLLEGADSAAAHAREAAPAAEGGVETGGRVYSGAEGLLAAVGEFAREAGGDGRPRDVYVYTSYLSWFSREPRFSGTCAELMRGMMERGHKITSVHNIGFDADEIFEMIETWLPLFLTGKVEARYLTRPNRSLFSEFMGAAGNCSVRFSTLRGGSVRPRAFFSESGEEAAFVREQVEGLAAYSKPLVAFFRKEDTERLYSAAENGRGADGDVIKLTRRPTMESMPENLAERIFARVAPSRDCFELLKRPRLLRAAEAPLRNAAGRFSRLAIARRRHGDIPAAHAAGDRRRRGAACAALGGGLLRLVHARGIRRAHGGARPPSLRARELPRPSPRLDALLDHRPDSKRGLRRLRSQKRRRARRGLLPQLAGLLPARTVRQEVRKKLTRTSRRASAAIFVSAQRRALL